MDYKEAMNVQYFALGVEGEVEKGENGSHIVRNVPVFRAGSFRDSKGRQHIWDETALDQIAGNFHTLRNNGIFPHVPLRTDHSRSTDSLAGYLVGMERREDKLVADLEFTEPEAYEKWKRGTYRSRSLEVGPFQSNDEQLFWPVAKGLAFVDIPAVEGLFSKSDVENAPPEPKENEPMPESTPPKADAHFTIRGVPTADVETVQRYIDELEGKGVPAAFEFSLADGATETDPEKVQAHIDTQAKALDDLDKAGRSDYVKQCVKDNKLPAPQEEATIELVKTFSGDQWAQFTKTYDDAPQLAPVGRTHGERRTDPPSEGGEKDAVAQEIEDLEGVVATFRRGNLSEEKIKKMPSYQRLQELKS